MEPMSVNINRIKILPFFTASPPRQDTMDLHRGETPYVIITDEKFRLIDGYASYLLAKEAGQREILVWTTHTLEKYACWPEFLPPVLVGASKRRPINVVSVSMRQAMRAKPGRHAIAIWDKTHTGPRIDLLRLHTLHAQTYYNPGAHHGKVFILPF